jgi:hypothetical protein
VKKSQARNNPRHRSLYHRVDSRCDTLGSNTNPEYLLTHTFARRILQFTIPPQIPPISTDYLRVLLRNRYSLPQTALRVNSSPAHSLSLSSLWLICYLFSGSAGNGCLQALALKIIASSRISVAGVWPQWAGPGGNWWERFVAGATCFSTKSPIYRGFSRVFSMCTVRNPIDDRSL